MNQSESKKGPTEGIPFSQQGCQVQKMIKGKIWPQPVSKMAKLPDHFIFGKQLQKSQIWLIWPCKSPNGNPASQQDNNANFTDERSSLLLLLPFFHKTMLMGKHSLIVIGFGKEE